MDKNHKGAMLTSVERKSKYLCAARFAGENAEDTKKQYDTFIANLQTINIK